MTETVRFALVAEDRSAPAFAAVKRALGGLDTAARGLKTSFAGIVPAVALGGVAALGARAIETAGALADLADQTGVSTDTLQVWRYAAAQSGVSVDQVDGALAKFTQTLGRAQKGERDAVESFRALGVGVLAAAGRARTADDAVAEVVAALAAIPDPTLRAAAEVELFGRAGQKLNPIIGEGAEGLARFGAEARNAGAVLDSRLIDETKRAADAWSALGREVWTTTQRLFAFAAAPVEAAGQKLREWNAAASGALAGPQGAKTDRINDLRAALAQHETGSVFLIPSMREAMEKELARLESAEAIGAPAASRGADFTPRSQDELKKIDAVVAALHRESEALEETARARAVSEQLAKAGLTADDAEAEVIAQLAGALHDEAQARRAVAEMSNIAAAQAAADEAARRKAVEDSAALLREKFNIGHAVEQEIDDNRRLAAALGVSLREYEKTAAMIEIENRYRAAGIPLLYEEIAIAERQAATLGEQRDAIRDMKERYDDAREAARDAFHVIGTGLEDAAVKGGNARDMLKGLEQDLARIAWRYTVTKPLERGVGKLVEDIDFGGIFSGLFSGGPDPADGSFGGEFRAAGGPVSAGSPYIVGEKGPELFVPGASGSIIPDVPMPRGATVNVSYAIDARGADAGVEARIDRALRESERRTLAAVAGLADRGGQFAKSVGRR